MFFVIPEMPSKTFVMLYKKLPDHFKYNVGQSNIKSSGGEGLVAVDEREQQSRY